MIFKVLAVALISAYCVIVVKQYNPEIAILLTVVSGIIIILMIIDYCSAFFDEIISLINSTGIDSEIVKYLVKIVFIGLATDIGCATIAESGQNSLAEKVALAGKVVVITMTIPIISKAFELVGNML